MRTFNLEHRLRPLVIALASISLAVGLLAPPAEAESPPQKKVPRDPNNITGISEAMEILVRGNAKFVQKDYAGAMELYQKALSLQPKHPLAHYLVGETHLAAGRLGEAEASLRTADDAAGGNSPYKPRVLFALADVLEREKKMEDAKGVWTRYLEYTGKSDGGVFPESAKARIATIDEWMKQDKTYDTVRQRIAAEKDGGANTPAAVPDAGAGKGGGSKK